MAEIGVLLDFVGQECCGPVRRVGDTFSSSIHNYRGAVYEERHADAVSIRCYPMEGRITGIAWRQLLSNEASNSGERYGPAIPIESTDDLPEDVDWILEFHG